MTSTIETISLTLNDDYIEHARRALTRVEKRLLEFETLDERQDGLDEIFREIHSIKGSAGFFNQQTLGRRAHLVENILDALRQRRLDYNDDIASFLMLGRDILALELEPESARVDRDSMTADFESRYQAIAKRISTQRRPRFDELREVLNMLEAESASSPEILETPHVHELFERMETLRSGLRTHREERWSQLLHDADLNSPRPELTDLQDMDLLTRRMKESPLSAAEAKRFRELLANLHDLHAANPRVLTAVVSLEPLSRFLDDERLASMPQFQSDVRRSMRELIVAVLGPHGPRVQKMGEILVEEGLVQPGDVEDAIGRQRRLGQILVEDGKVSQADVDRSLSRQRRQLDFREMLDEPGPTLVSVRRARLEKLADNIRKTRELYQARGAAAPPQDAAEPALLSLLDELQSIAGELLMVRFGDLVDHMPRYVHDVSKYLKTQADLTIDGAEIEIERHVADLLSAALVHLVNNALAHGIESETNARTAMDKPSRGQIRICAIRDERSLRIEVSDDGRGLNREKILEKAASLGVFADKAVQDLRDEDVWRLVFHPRLTTSSVVNEISGRGVGMNVVIRAMEDLGGAVEIDNRPGRGVTVRLVIPSNRSSG